jgi:uncharacterized circularly permuted ATP-grasp superfamily protein/uncharacterized alpha-E superfamily protein
VSSETAPQLTAPETAGGLVAAYRPLPSVFDEMVDETGLPRQQWSPVGRMIDGLGVAELGRRRGEAARLLANDGVEYQLPTTSTGPSTEPSTGPSTGPDTGGPGSAHDRRWELDPLPVVLDSAQWAELERGVIQRAELLSLILADLYGQRRLVRSGMVPPELLFDHPGFLREADQISIPGSQLPTCAVDVARDADGAWWALTDRTQTPSGFGYALENRVVLSRVFPSMYRDVQAHRLAPFFRGLRSALRAAAPRGADEPRIVVLSPGPWAETAFEHAFLASYLGYALVEGADLTVRDGRVWLRSLGQLEPVDVILRRVDGSYCDPLELRSESLLGVPGLLEACRLGTVSVVNPIGSGVLENPSLLALLPRLCRHMLGQPLRLPSVPTWWCGDRDGRRHVLTNLHRMVIKSTTREKGAQTYLGWELSLAERNDLARLIDAGPHSWVGQEPLELSTVPAAAEHGLEPRHMLLRTFLAARGESYAAMPGALARIAPTGRGALIARRGVTRALYKDVWVAASEPEEMTGFWLRSERTLDSRAAATPIELPPTARAAENLFWLGRYAERAEALVRLLRVVEDRRNDFADGMNPAGNACLRSLLEALGQISGCAELIAAGPADPAGGPELDDTLRALITDAGRPGSLAYSVRRLRDSAYPVRDQLSGDTWLVLGALERELLGNDSRSAGPASGPGQLARVLTSLLALGGLTGESMVHDQGWRFMNAGRRLERALQMATLLKACVGVAHDTATDSLLLESVLTAAESIITYRRRYRSHAQLGTVLGLLLLDPENPRSVVYQVESLGQDVAAVARRDTAGKLTETERVVLQTSTAVRLTELGDLVDVEPAPDGVELPDRAVGRRPQLAAQLELTVRQLERCGETIASEHFTHLLPQRRLPTPGMDDADGNGSHLRLV